MKTDSDLNPKSLPKSRVLVAAFTRSVSLMMAGRMKKEKKLPGAMGSGLFYAIIKYNFFIRKPAAVFSNENSAERIGRHGWAGPAPEAFLNDVQLVLRAHRTPVAVVRPGGGVADGKHPQDLFRRHRIPASTRRRASYPDSYLKFATGA